MTIDESLAEIVERAVSRALAQQAGTSPDFSLAVTVAEAA